MGNSFGNQYNHGKNNKIRITSPCLLFDCPQAGGTITLNCQAGTPDSTKPGRMGTKLDYS